MRARLLLAVVAAPVVALAAGAGLMLVTGANRRLGVSDAEYAAPLPGDDLLPRATAQNDRAITIQAPPQHVWPWLAQIGQDKAGFYSFELLENAMGCQISGADHINPAWQDVEAGDLVRLSPDLAIRVADVEPGHHLVLTSEGGEVPEGAEDDWAFDFTWAFVLTPAGVGATRLRTRERFVPQNAATARMLHASSLLSAVMTWRMLRRIRALAER